MPELRWRKRQACVRCRRYKVRCEYNEREDNKCVRCAKAYVDCVQIPAAQEKTPRVKSFKENVEEELYHKSSTASEGSIETGNSSKGDLSNNESPATQDSNPQMCVIVRSKGVQPNKKIASNNEGHQVDKKKTIRDLSNAIEEARSMIKILQQEQDKEAVIQNAPFNSSKITDWNHLPARPNIMSRAFETGLITPAKAEILFNFFFENMATQMPSPFGLIHEYEDMVKNEPILVGAIVVAGSMSFSIDAEFELLLWVEKELYSRLVITAEPSIELAKALVVLAQWVITPWQESSELKHLNCIYLLTVLGGQLDLGSNEDLQDPTLSDPKSPARLRVKLCLNIYCASAAVGLNSSKMRIVEWLPRHERCCRALLINGPLTTEEQFILIMIRCFSSAQQAMTKLTSSAFDPIPLEDLISASGGLTNGKGLNSSSSHFNIYETGLSEMSSDAIQEIICSFRASLNGIVQNFCQSSGPENLQLPDPLSLMLDTCHCQSIVAVYEQALIRIGFKPQGPSYKLYVDLLHELANVTESVCNKFISKSSTTAVFPKIGLFRPVQALTSLFRIKLIAWTKGIEVEQNVGDLFNQVKSQFTELMDKTYLARRIFESLTVVEGWMKMNGNDMMTFENCSSDQDGADPSVAVSLQKFLMMTKRRKDLYATATGAITKEYPESVTSSQQNYDFVPNENLRNGPDLHTGQLLKASSIFFQEGKELKKALKEFTFSPLEQNSAKSDQLNTPRDSSNHPSEAEYYSHPNRPAPGPPSVTVDIVDPQIEELLNELFRELDTNVGFR